ncbi:MAG: hypothetical protein M3463_04060 [Verrucomicrobiota bacterium]|nr:hypothetical protein [Verrucomicrobiota bacterium]
MDSRRRLTMNHFSPRLFLLAAAVARFPLLVGSKIGGDFSAGWANLDSWAGVKPKL